jgi:hypothetical protein
MPGKSVIEAQFTELETALPDADVGGINPLNKHLQNEVRRTIKAIELVRVLQNHVLLSSPLDKTQILAACKLLDKVVSNAPVEIQTENKPIAIGASTREELLTEILRDMAREAGHVAAAAITSAANSSK